MPIRSWFLMSLALFGSLPLAAVTPHLVKDVNPAPQPAGSSPADFVSLGSVALFTASDGDTGTELWRTDGTLAGTFRLTDTCPDECSGQIRPAASTGTSYFFAASGAFGEGEDLWVTDGSPAGTLRLTSSLAFPTSGRWAVWAAGPKVLYFSADDGVHGFELWRSDGTPAGTFLVADALAGPRGSGPLDLTVVAGSRLFFNAGGGQGPGLWKSDGTARGTSLVLDPVPGSAAHAGPTALSAASSILYFTAPAAKGRTQLWRSDGTAPGTFALTSLIPRPGGRPAFFSRTALGNRVYFTADAKGQGQELWTTDGTVKGTVRLTNFQPDEAFYSADLSFALPLPARHLGNRVVFAAADGSHGVEPWTTDGTARGTRLLQDVCAGACSGAGPAPPVPGGQLLYFAGVDRLHGEEPWVTDGTPLGTRILRDLCPGKCGSAPAGFEAAAGRVYFQAQEREEIWSTNGSTEGTLALVPYRIPSFPPTGLQKVVLGGSLLFTSYDDEAGLELWRSNGTPRGSALLADLDTTDLGGSNPRELTVVGDQIYFYAEGRESRGIWKSDGTDTNTQKVFNLAGLIGIFDSQATLAESGGTLYTLARFQELASSVFRLDPVAGRVRLPPAGLRVSSASGLVVLGSTLFFVGGDFEAGEELWATDGTVAGTRRVVDLEPGAGGSSPDRLTVFGGHLYFTAATRDTGQELWRTDGTAAGTVLMKDVHPAGNSDPDLLTVHEGRLWFAATSAEHGRELWVTDGTAVGTREEDLEPGPESFNPARLIWDGPRLFLSGGPTGQTGLWIWDGPSAPPRRLGESIIVPDLSGRSDPALAAGTLYFQGFQPGFGSTLWKSDGTPEGTVQLLDREGQPVLFPEFFQAFAGHVFFTTDRGDLYQTDGTPSGTFPLLSLAEPGNIARFELVRAGARLFFPKWDRANGTELWALEEN